MKIKLSNKLNIINQKNLRINYFEFYFPIGRIELKDFYNYRILSALMSLYSIKYPEPDLFNYACDENMVNKYNVSIFEKGDTAYLKINFAVPEEGIFEDFDLKESLSFVYDTLFNSICLNKESLNEDKYILQYRRVKEKIERSLSDIEGVIDNYWFNQIDENKEFCFGRDVSLDLINNHTSIDRVIELYNKCIINNYFVSFVNGNVFDEDEYRLIFNDVFKIKEKEFELDIQYDKIYNLTLNGEVTKTSDEYNQTCVIMQFKKKDYVIDEEYLLKMLHWFLSGRENRLLFKKLRTDYNIIYRCGALSRRNVGVIELRGYLNKDNIDTCKKAMIEIIEDLKNKDFFDECKKNLVKGNQIQLYSLLDSKFIELDNAADKVLHLPLVKEELEELEKISYEEFVKFINKLEKTNTLIFVGDK